MNTNTVPEDDRGVMPAAVSCPRARARLGRTLALSNRRRHELNMTSNFNRVLRGLGYAVVRVDDKYSLVRYEPLRTSMSNKDVQKFINENRNVLETGLATPPGQAPPFIGAAAYPAGSEDVTESMSSSGSSPTPADESPEWTGPSSRTTT